MSSDRELDPSRWLTEHGDILYRYALGRVRDPQVAEDMVQDTFLAAMKGKEGFSGRSTERTWLVGILKHKIIDHYRKHRREVLSENLELIEIPAGTSVDPKGNWKLGQSEWISNPEKAFQRKEFWAVLNQCVEKLNPRHKEVFVLRELQEHEAGDICKDLGISESNLWVMLHRARLQLKLCLENNWLNKAVPES
jgi:RNA polymerase sigma-70 factor, ECF subfamily